MSAENQQGDAFSIVYTSGRILADISPGASVNTLVIAQGVFAKLTLQVLGRSTRTVEAEPPQDAGRSTVPRATGFEIPFSSSTPVANTAGEHEPVLAPSKKAADSPVWLSEAVDQWHEAQTFSAQTWKYAYAPSFRILRELIGDTRRDVVDADGRVRPNVLDIDLRTLERRHIKALHDLLKAFPHRQGKRQDGLEAHKRIELAAKSKQKTMTPENVEKKLTHVSPFFAWAERKGYVPTEVRQEMELVLAEARARVIKTSGRESSTYVSLTADELKKVFESDTFRIGAIQNDWAYWVPLLCLFMGLRIAEASQIRKSDLVEVDGVWCLKLVTILEPREGANRPAQSEEARRLKTRSSRRTVPIHPKLTELGLLDFLRDAPDDDIAFSNLNWHDKDQWSRKPREAFDELLKATGVHEARRKVPHSVRSNCHQSLKKTGLNQDAIQRVLGHATKQMGDEHYGETEDGPYVAARLVLTHMEMVVYPITFPTWTEILAHRRAPFAARDRRRT